MFIFSVKQLLSVRNHLTRSSDDIIIASTRFAVRSTFPHILFIWYQCSIAKKLIFKALSRRCSMKTISITAKSLIAIIFLLSLISCGGGGGGSAGGGIAEGQAKISGTVQADPSDSTASGEQAGSTVYVVGQQDKATTTDSNGNFNLTVDATLSGTILSSPKGFLASLFKTAGDVKQFGLVVLSKGNAYGKHGRKTEVQVTEGQATTLDTIYINKVGTISGKALLQGKTDHTGITVFIPGTSFTAMTAADGRYTISDVPAGKYDVVRAEKLGETYHYAVTAQVTVNSGADTQLPDMLLQLTTDPNGAVLINSGDIYTTTKTVTLSLAPGSSTQVLMGVSEYSDFHDLTSWEPVQASKQHTFSGDYSSGGTATIYAKFADSSGLQTVTYVTDTIYINTNPQSALLTPSGTTNLTLPVFDWADSPIPNATYHFQLAENTSFSPTIVDTTTTVSQYALTSANKLLNGHNYYWRVAIVDETGKEWPFAAYKTASVDLQSVGLVSPADTTRVGTKTPALSWTKNSIANTYTLTIADDVSLTTNVAVITGITGTGTTLPGATITTDGTYYWAVMPVDVNGVSGTRSSAWSFIVDTTGPAGNIIINNGDTYTSSEVVSVAISATDGAGVSQYQISMDGTTYGAWQTYSGATTTVLNYTDLVDTSGPYTITSYVKFKDTLGNINASAYSDTISLKRTFPMGDQSGTWTVANSPYILRSGGGVSVSTSLTIEAGVSVQYDCGNCAIAVTGTLISNGTSTNHISFGPTLACSSGTKTCTNTNLLYFQNANLANSQLNYVDLLRTDTATYTTTNAIALSTGNTNTLAVQNAAITGHVTTGVGSNNGSNGVSLSGATITNADLIGSSNGAQIVLSSSSMSGGSLVSSDSQTRGIHIKNSTVTGNGSYYLNHYSGVATGPSVLSFETSTVSSGTIQAFTSSLSITGSKFTNMQILASSSSATITSSLFTYNSSYPAGYSYGLTLGSGQMTKSRIEGYSTMYSGLFIGTGNGGALTITASDIANAPRSVYISGGSQSISITGSNFEGHTGPVIECQRNATITATGNFWDMPCADVPTWICDGNEVGICLGTVDYSNCQASRISPTYP